MDETNGPTGAIHPVINNHKSPMNVKETYADLYTINKVDESLTEFQVTVTQNPKKE